MTSRAPRPIRIVQVGAGAMGRAWLHTLADSADVELVGLVDVDLDVAREAAASCGFGGPVATSLDALETTTDAQALLNVTVPAAHHSVTTDALFRGMAVLSEKPLADSVSQGLSLMAAAEATGQLLMVSQSRHYWPHLSAFRDQMARLGQLGSVSCEFARGVHFGGFREQMAFPLLVDMAIHHFDLARDLLGTEPVAVFCDSHNPVWSWFDGDAAAVAVFEFADGARFSYVGTWCSTGLETSWNGRWRIDAADGSGLWDGNGPAVASLTDGSIVEAVTPEEPEQIAASLADFVHALRTGSTPWGEVHSNVLSLAMVEAAIASATQRRRVLLAEVLDAAHRQAVSAQTRGDVRAVLQAWPSVSEAVGRLGAR